MSFSANTFLAVSRQILVYGGSSVVSFGIFGSVMILLIFSRKPLNENPCSKYIRANAILSLFFLPFYFLPTILTHGLQINVLAFNTSFCKFQSSYAGFTITSIFIINCFIFFDRYVISSRSVRMRSYSSKHIAQTLITIGLCIAFGLIGIPAAIFYENIPLGPNGSYICASRSNRFLLCVAMIYFPILEGILPFILAVVFWLLTRKQVRTVHNKDLVRRLDRQITRMYLFQILINTIASAPFAIINLYRSLPLKTARTQDQENTVQSFRLLGLWLFYVQYCTDFYIYLAVSNEIGKQAVEVLCFWCRQRITSITYNHEMTSLRAGTKTSTQY
ncbi:unnamed protein product [Rotaria magnacalcarata]|uniref:G-protein coupled receptors family 1 profile domain-containing protein n=1 Tax=Rotaria magnacalcarata TaxID=392030 RepID=A0A819UIQ9_9BILA|nr:unnamed protein product [Rotaria magnacalcarata]CAF2067048.1 unnamed protein product [Rotaria magnacalcarata]CAF4094935.1 unnamed protein product [Rotaria magnacalcarata]CAF4225963.1 unnamed protein product [Rotaria magnacalcarata]